MKKGTLYWITGLAGSGKTTIGLAVYQRLREKKEPVILLDGDILKRIVGKNTGYSKEERLERAWKYAYLCRELTEQGIHVICCTIAMFDAVRKWNRENNEAYVEVFLNVPMQILKQRNKKGLYSGQTAVAGLDVEAEFPKNPSIVLDNDGHMTAEACASLILECVPEGKRNSDYEEYWDSYYQTERELEPSKFARFCFENYMEKGKSLLEIGCGNGRDSLYFLEKGIYVTGVDSSIVAIKGLRDRVMRTKKEGLFLCADFVDSDVIYQRNYDYCYSRFTLHAINKTQEVKLLKNICNGFEKGGLLFIECRSVDDSLYGKGEQVEENAYIYHGHFRRFLELEYLKKELVNLGMEILYAKQAHGFAPKDGEDPAVIRIVGKYMGIPEV